MRKQCLCGSKRPFSSCCEPHLKTMLAPTAEALMRSRYTAFCLQNVDYLIATHHPSKARSDARKSLRQTMDSTEWTNLRIVATQKGQKKDKTGTVEFVAAYRSQPSAGVGIAISTDSLSAASPAAAATAQLHERSRFIKENGRWFYLDGEILPTYRPGRSQPCWCGSGKPFKHCHETTS